MTFSLRHFQNQFRPNCIRLAAHVSERDIGMERRRFHSAGDVTNFFAVAEKFTSFLRQRFQVIGQVQTTQLFRHLTNSMYAIQNFLAGR